MPTMRELINLLEAAAPDTERLAHILGLIHGFVTRGPIEDHLMDDVMRDLPRPASGMKLWRVVNLDPKQVKKLTKGLTIPTHRYLSWTSNEDAIYRLAHARQSRGPVAVIHMEFPADQICVDVQKFVEYLHDLESENPNLDFDTADIISYADEAEVIVAHPTPLKLNGSNTSMFAARNSEHPKVGDKVFSAHSMSEDSHEIESVLKDNGDGSWDVRWYAGMGQWDEGAVHCTAPGEWETIEEY